MLYTKRLFLEIKCLGPLAVKLLLTRNWQPVTSNKSCNILPKKTSPFLQSLACLTFHLFTSDLGSLCVYHGKQLATNDLGILNIMKFFDFKNKNLVKVNVFF